jgi:hypothetical protein
MPIKRKFDLLVPFMDERLRRLWAAAEAADLGHGSVSRVSRATGLSRATIRAGINELEAFRDDPNRMPAPGRVRRAGAGRPPLTRSDPALLTLLEGLIDPLTRGDRNSPLRWTCKSTPALAEELRARGHSVSVRSVASLLHRLGYCLGGQRGGRGDKGHAQRNAQFEYLNAQIADFQNRGWPVIAVEAKREEWTPPPPEEGGAAPVTGEGAGTEAPDLGDAGAGAHSWVDRDATSFTIEWAAEVLQRWWRHTDPQAYPGEAELLVAVDLGDGDCSQTWKGALQGLADRIGRRVTASHLPPGTIKWNRSLQCLVLSHATNGGPGNTSTRHKAVVRVPGLAPPAEDRPLPGAGEQAGGEVPPCPGT